jgi:hypothetical protein
LITLGAGGPTVSDDITGVEGANVVAATKMVARIIDPLSWRKAFKIDELPRDRRDRQPEADHANSNQGIITLLEVSLFTSRHRSSSANV